MPLAGITKIGGDIVLGDGKDAKVIGHVETTFNAGAGDGRFNYTMKWTLPQEDKTKGKQRHTTAARSCRNSAGRSPSLRPRRLFLAPQGLLVVLPERSHRAHQRNGDTRIGGRAGRYADHATGLARFRFDEVRLRLGDACHAGGRGIAVKFAGNDRQHCRAGTAADGRSRLLVVNKQAPRPRDISSNVVPDYYMKDTRASGSFTVGATAGSK